MKRLTIYTQNHEKLLREFAQEFEMAAVKFSRHKKTRNNFFGVRFSWEGSANLAVVERLVFFLQDVALLENPIYRHSAKLREMACGLRETPTHSKEVQRLKAFLRGSRVLHLEGYILFRMGEYRHKLDIMSYRAIKKMELVGKE